MGTKNFMFALGMEEGEIIVFDINKHGREDETREVARLKNRPSSREIKWSGSRGEILVGNSDGSVTVWDAKKTSPICIFNTNTLIIIHIL
jgi:WD40 repeat protein